MSDEVSRCRTGSREEGQALQPDRRCCVGTWEGGARRERRLKASAEEALPTDAIDAFEIWLMRVS